MKRNRRLSVALHVLVHLVKETRTSEDLARCVGTNPVVIRRTLAGLREAGLVRSVAGHHGGWSLAVPAGEITLGGVCRALGERLLFTVELDAPTGCHVQAALSGAMDALLEDAESMLLQRLDRVTLASLAALGSPRQPEH